MNRHFLVLILFRMGIFGAAHGWWGGGGGGDGEGAPLSLKSFTQILQWWSLAQLYLTLRRSKNIWITWHTPWVLLTSVFFHRKSANVVISRNTDIDCILIHFDTFSNSFNFSWVFKDFFNKPGYNFDDVSKNGYPRLS